MSYGDIKRGFERAHPLGHVPTVQNELVKRRLERYKLPARDVGDAVHEARVRSLLIPARDLPGTGRDVRYVMAVDGSDHEEEVDPRFPASRSLFMQIAGILVDLHKMRETRHGFPIPSAIADAQDAAVFAGFLPSSNLPCRDDDDPFRAFRRELNTLLHETHVNGTMLLEAFQKIEGLRTRNSLAAAKQTPCPTEGCDRTIEDLHIDLTGSTCPSCGQPIWLTDLLRIHDEFKPWGDNRSVASRVRMVLEQLTLAAFGASVRRRALGAFDTMAFIADGPLALFGPPARLRLPLLRFWRKLAAIAVDADLQPPLVLGIEKTGEFIDHARDLGDLLEPGQLMQLPTSYIQEYIRFRESDYGVGTYFGRKFIYRTTAEGLVVFTIPPLGGAVLDREDKEVGPYGKGGDRLELSDFPTLGATCSLLDSIGTRLYEDAVIPLALAHRWAAYPLRTAGSVLNLYAKEHLAAPEQRPAA
jgi:hypothetical protein